MEFVQNVNHKDVSELEKHEAWSLLNPSTKGEALQNAIQGQICLNMDLIAVKLMNGTAVFKG